MKHIVTGIVAHVDAGKTTLSEALLYRSGELRQLGRVDNGDAFLDSDALEKQRGITIFSHQANLQYQDLAITLLDTPGHVDFASQTEQVLSVLDYAILVVAATDGIQGYTQTLWHLLERYQVPTFVFVNKMDAPGIDKTAVLEQLQAVLSPGILEVETMTEEVALQDEAVLDDYLAQGELPDATIRRMIQRRQVFPVYFGAALKLDGVDDFLAGFNRWTNEATGEAEFGARVFKISHDDKGERLTWVRVTGGELATKAMILPDKKINQLRQYNGEKYTVVPNVMAGQICVIPGLEETYPGQGLGALADAVAPFMQPVLNYALDPKDNDIHACLAALRQLEDEDPQLHVMWSSQLQELRVQIMGPIQLEVLQQLLLTRFDLDVAFGEGSILYKETITAPIEGVGHFEPLRHYAEVHLLLQPAAVGSGLTFDADVPVDVLGQNWQHQVLSSLGAKEHLGVLTGSPITDMRVTLVNGRASNVHSVGGDFREATWRALRQGLMMAKVMDTAQLLEPWYQFRLVVAPDQIGRAMIDVQRMSGQFDAPETNASNAVLTGTAPVSEMQDYAREVQAYTHGQGQLELVVAGYQPCHNAAEVIESRAYNPTGDVANTPDSVFCAHGAGYPVAWDQVPEAAHVAYLAN